MKILNSPAVIIGIIFTLLPSMCFAEYPDCTTACFNQTGNWIQCSNRCANYTPPTYDPSEYDYACVSVCTQQGNNYNYCLKQCSY